MRTINIFVRLGNPVCQSDCEALCHVMSRITYGSFSMMSQSLFRTKRVIVQELHSTVYAYYCQENKLCNF